MSIQVATQSERPGVAIAADDFVVAGFDGSASAARALEWAASEAVVRRSGLRVVACSVVPTEVDYYGIGSRQLTELSNAVEEVRDRYPVLFVEQLVTHLDPRDALLDAALGADLLVIGESASGTLKALFAGSTARRAARRSPRPVVVVRGERRLPVGTIVVGVDETPAAQAAADWAAYEAARHGATLVVAHAWQPGDRIHRDDAWSIVNALTSRCRERANITVHGELVEGPPAAALVALAASSDLLVVGSSSRNGLSTMVFGSVSLAAIEHASCPVAVVNPAPPSGGATP